MMATQQIWKENAVGARRNRVIYGKVLTDLKNLNLYSNSPYIK